MKKPIPPFLMLVTQPTPNLPWIVSESLLGGVNMVQWRQKSGVGTGFSRVYASLQAVIQDAVPLIANIAWDSAVSLHVPNIQLPEKSPAVKVARKLVGSKGIVGKSVHSVESAVAAQEDGADYVLAGTVFQSSSHPEMKAAGPDFIAAVCAAVTIPVIAIGGITVDNLGLCIAAGAAGVAILSPIILSKDPAATAANYRAALDQAWSQKYAADN